MRNIKTVYDRLKYKCMKTPGIQYVLPVFLLITLVYITASSNKISTRTYRVETPLLEEQGGIRIVLISDLHSVIYGKNQTALIDMIKSSDPDLIVLAGDIFDDEVPMTGTKLLLSGISGIVPVYYVTGNHEYWSHNIQAIRDELTSYGVIILSDTYAVIEVNNNKIILAGVEDPHKKYYETPSYNQSESMESAFRELDEIPLYKILTAHRPEMIGDYKKYSFDLILSGHTHGGQFRIPYIMNGLYAPNQGFFPTYAGGIYKHGNLTHIVSRGLAINSIVPRIFNPPELVIVKIESNKGR